MTWRRVLIGLVLVTWLARREALAGAESRSLR